jgi:hypothetical protein
MLSSNLFVLAMSNWAQATQTKAVFTLVWSAAFHGTVREEYIFFHRLEIIVSEGTSNAPCRWYDRITSTIFRVFFSSTALVDLGLLLDEV